MNRPQVGLVTKVSESLGVLYCRHLRRLVLTSVARLYDKGQYSMCWLIFSIYNFTHSQMKYFKSEFQNVHVLFLVTRSFFLYLNYLSGTWMLLYFEQVH